MELLHLSLEDRQRLELPIDRDPTKEEAQEVILRFVDLLTEIKAEPNVIAAFSHLTRN